MNWAILLETRAGRGIAAAFTLSAVVFLYFFVRAVRLDAVPEAPPLTFSTADALARRTDAPPVDIRAAVERDPFAQDRTAPESRYRIPGEPDDVKVTAIEPAKPVVLGVMLSDAARSFATCTLENGPPTIVRVGDKLGIYTVTLIERGRVTFTTTDGKRIVITAAQPGTI